MGYRLEVKCVDNKDINFYGTKLVGYVDPQDLDSIKYLVYLGKIEDFEVDYIWNGGSGPYYELEENQFNNFIRYYRSDLMKHKQIDVYTFPEIQKVMNCPGNKIIGWC